MARGILLQSKSTVEKEAVGNPVEEGFSLGGVQIPNHLPLLIAQENVGNDGHGGRVAHRQDYREVHRLARRRDLPRIPPMDYETGLRMSLVPGIVPRLSQPIDDSHRSGGDALIVGASGKVTPLRHSI